MNRFIRNTGFYLLIFLVILGIVNFINQKDEKTQEISYAAFQESVRQGQVTEITVQPEGLGTYYVEGTYIDKKPFFLHAPMAESTVDFLTQEGLKNTWKKVESDSVWLTFLTSIIPFV